MAIAAARRAELPLVLAGPISDTAYFKRAIAPSLGDQVRYAGHLNHDELARLVGRSAAALVTPAWHEPYGLVVAEAMSCGTPVVAFARGGIPEIVSPQGGRLVPPNDVEAMADEIPAALSLARIDVHRHAVARCSAEAMVTAYLDLYRTMIDDRNEKPHDRLLHPPPRLRSPQSSHQHLRPTSPSGGCVDVAGHPKTASVRHRPSRFRVTTRDPRPAEPSANGALHWVPHHDDGLRTRMALIARWIEVDATSSHGGRRVSRSCALRPTARRAGDRDGDARRTHRRSACIGPPDRRPHRRGMATRTLRAGMAAGIRRQDQLCRRHQPFRGPRGSATDGRTARPPSSFSAGRADATSTSRRSMRRRPWYPRSVGRH